MFSKKTQPFLLLSLFFCKLESKLYLDLQYLMLTEVGGWLAYHVVEWFPSSFVCKKDMEISRTYIFKTFNHVAFVFSHKSWDRIVKKKHIHLNT